jgi:hypothetical protein
MRPTSHGTGPFYILGRESSMDYWSLCISSGHGKSGDAKGKENGESTTSRPKRSGSKRSGSKPTKTVRFMEDEELIN